MQSKFLDVKGEIFVNIPIARLGLDIDFDVIIDMAVFLLSLSITFSKDWC